MKYVTLLATKGIINKIPIFISLNDWALSKTSLIDYIKRQFDICSFPDAELFITEVLLKKGRAMVLFDGLDEVNEENDRRREITRQISDFTNQYSENSYIITCRVAATDYSFEKFPYVEVADFTDEQVETFVSKWFAHDFEKGKRCLNELERPENKRLRELGKTPVLLNLLCLNYDESLSFPTRRAEIYQEGIDVLLKKWDASRNIKRDEIYKGLTYGRRHQMFSRLAAEYFEKGETLFKEDELSINIGNILQTFPSSSSGETPDGFYVLRSIEAQHGLLIERAYRIHSFSHLTFQEYFTARNIVDHVADGSLNLLMTHITHKRWREVFLLTASLLADAEFFFESFHKAKDTLVINDPIVIEVLNWTLEKAKQYTRSNIFVARNYVFDLNRDIVRIANRIRFITESQNPIVAADENYLNPDEDAAGDWLRSLGESSEEESDDEKVKDENIETDKNYLIDVSLKNIFAAILERLIGFCKNDSQKANDTGSLLSEWRNLVEYSQEVQITRLIRDLGAISLGKIDTHNKEIVFRAFLDFANKYQTILQKHRNIGIDRKMNFDQRENIDKFLRASSLMFECLRLSVVSDRKKIEGRLLSLPTPPLKPNEHDWLSSLE